MITFEQLTTKYAAWITQADDRDGVWSLTTTPDALHLLLEALCPEFAYPEDLTVIDEGELLRVLYRLAAPGARRVAHVQVRIPRAQPHLPTATDLWRGYDWQEREAYDLFGVVFDGHPDLRRILTWEGFQGYPLRKDYLIDNDDSSWLIPEQTDQAIVELLEKI